jgi:phosphatidylcholine synthase
MRSGASRIPFHVSFRILSKSLPSVMQSLRGEKAARLGKKIRAYGVHAFTASGIVFAFLAVAELFVPSPDPRWVFGWLAIAGAIDAADGPLARLWDVKTHAARIGGDSIDDIVDYLTFTFIPLLLVWRMDWLPDPATLWVVLAMGASLFGFANTRAKQTEAGFFLGFPSYWNIVAYYVGILVVQFGEVGAILSAAAVVGFTVLTVLPVRFIYPNQVAPPWRLPIVVGGIGWVALLLALLPIYPAVPLGWLALSLIYPAFYFGLSGYLDITTRQA